MPEGILCSKTHEWIAQDNNEYIVGLTDIMAQRLGDIVSIELPEVGLDYAKDEVFATIESVRMANELYMPVSGEVIEINENLINSPELINENPFEAWLVKIKADNFQEDSQDLIEYNDYVDELWWIIATFIMYKNLLEFKIF